ncbi:AAA family ATPase [Corallococcus sp. CA047B]|uniref:AAA family ATPase n=1 Tax=Corallococcus sp. CA047B TaxID=2316729 RepID=UPI0013150BDA|nr:AAA family ATPase [Corallococcus sp. CA047B]
MRIKSIKLRNIKSFDGAVTAAFEENTKLFAFSGTNGAGKSTLLRIAWLIQKAHFVELDGSSTLREPFVGEVLRYLTAKDSRAELTLDIAGSGASIWIERAGRSYAIGYSDKGAIDTHWNLQAPNNLILYVDASKGFSETTLGFDELSIARNDRHEVQREAIYHPERLFSGIYRQLVKDYVHDRLIPSKPDRLLYYHVASKLFTKLIPGIELKNFSGNHKPGEFVLLGKAGGDKYRPLYDVREFSSGEKALLSTLAFLCISKSVSALIIDEPENHFHESLLLEFMSVLHRLTEKGGIHTWIAAEAPASGKKINMDWVEEYRENNLEQVIVSTHSKSLIYKFFSVGKNFIVSRGVQEMVYEKAESQLRELGLSTTYSKVILVEGDGDNAALEVLVKGRNVKIKPLDGSRSVLETFRRLAEIREYVRDSRFVFLIDSDNKPSQFFSDLRAVNNGFYDEAFVSLDVHEFENLFLEEGLFKQVVDAFNGLKGKEGTGPGVAEVRAKLVEIAKTSLPQVYKKELSLVFQQVVANHFAGLVWGKKSFVWDDPAKVSVQIASALTPQVAQELNQGLVGASKGVFD